MKSLLTFLSLCLLCSLHLCAQLTPACTFNYQAAVRDASDVIIANRNVGFRLSVLDQLKGNPLYSETHAKVTSSLGLASLEVGAGTKVGGTMEWMDIQWGSKPYYLRVEGDINGGTNYELIGEAPVLSVPIANHAKSALTALGLPSDAIININELNAETVNALEIAADSWGYEDEFGNFTQVFKKNNNLFILLIDKIFADDICTESLAIQDGPTGVPFTAVGFEKDGSSFLDVDKVYAGQICADDLILFDEHGEPLLDINPAADFITEYGFIFNHNIMVNGGIMAEFKQFVIDHPLDPENKNLRHFSIESDKMVNMYTGTITLDKRGEAWIQLPEWFEALNADFSYQLTCIGGHADVYIAEKIHQNQFRIAGGKKNMEVSWQVSGVRHDKQAKELNLPVEEMKRK